MPPEALDLGELRQDIVEALGVSGDRAQHLKALPLVDLVATVEAHEAVTPTPHARGVAHKKTGPRGERPG